MTLRIALLVLIASLLLAAPVAAQPSAVGQWTTLPTLPFFPVHVMLLPSGQVMMWPGDEGISGDDALLWDPATATTTPLAHVGYDLFCSGHSHLADGRMFVTGGHIQNFVGLPRAAIYDPVANAWTPVPDMNAGRWYPTNTTLPNGDVLVVSGDVDTTVGVNTLPQVFEMATGAWRDLTDAQLGLELYPYMHVAPNGLIFNSGPSLTTRYLDTSGTGTWTTVANRNDGFRDYGGSVMYAPGKIITMGGDDPARATAEVIDLNAPSPAWRSVSSMAIARRQMNSTILPDGRVLVSGGTNGPGFNNLDTPVFPAEMWDPGTETWTTMASASVPRLYHSAALLLPDGRVLNTGGNEHPEVQVFEPPYLFKGTRPSITAAPGSVSYGQTALVQTPDAVARVTLIRIGAVTHTNNMDQRFNELPFTPAGSGVNVTFPSGPTLAPPGHYLLFVLNSQGVPSVGRILRLGGGAASTGPTVTALTPSQASANGPDFTLTIDGSGFVAGATVQWNGSARPTTFVSDARLTASISNADIANAGTATVRVVNPDTQASNAATFTIGAGCPAGQFLAEYFANPTLSGTPVRTACESTINYDWGTGGPAGLPTDNFSVRWTGSFSFPAGTTTFTATADDGIRVFVDGTSVIDAWRDQAATTYTGTRTLTAGQHDVKVEYYEASILAVAQVSWSAAGSVNPILTALSPNSAAPGGPGFTLTATGSNFVAGSIVTWNGNNRPTTFVSATQLTAAIPASDIASAGQASVAVRNDAAVSNALTFAIGSGGGSSCPTGQFFAEYFANVALSGTAVRTACEPTINYNWGGGGPAGLPTDNFSVRWTGRFTLPAGNTTFTATADDGVRVYVDGTLIIDAWVDQPATTYTATRTLTAGDHDVKVEYYERGGLAVAQVSWNSAAATGPTLATLTPASATAGGPAFTLTADGSNFVSGATLLWNGAARPTTFVSATRVTASITAADIAAAASIPVTVQNPNGVASNALTFSISSGGGSACPTGQFFAEYFANVSLSGTAARTACEPTINYNWGSGGPAGLPTDNFSVRWTGRFTLPAGDTTFSATADDGVRLYVDGTLVIDAWVDQPATTYTATRTLTAGDHEIKVEYYERGGLAVAQVSWNSAAPSGPTLATLTPATATAGAAAFTLTADGSNFVSGTTLFWNGSARPTTFVSATRVTASITAADVATPASIPVTVQNPTGAFSNAQTFTVTSSVGSCPTGQFFAEYFANVSLSGTAVRTACEPTINYNWGGGGPAGLPTDNFSVRWTGRFTFNAGDTTFSATADDGVRLYVDGALIIDAWVDQPATTYTATRTLTAGDHDVRVEYYERGGLAVAQVSWTSSAPTGPTLATLTPATAAAGGPAFTLTADGSNFVSGATLLWNGAARPTTFVSSTRVTAAITAADIAAPASVSVTVQNPNGVVSNAQTFTVGSSVAACPTGQFFAQYFNNVSLSGSPVQTACESSIYYNWGSGGPAGLPVDNFSVRWTGRFQFSGGNTTFTVAADDGVRLYVDGVLVIDAWIDQGATTYTATRTLTAGEHEVRVEYYERTGDAVIQVLF